MCIHIYYKYVCDLYHSLCVCVYREMWMKTALEMTVTLT